MTCTNRVISRDTPPVGIPKIDIEPLRTEGADATEVASAIRRACRESGFFYVVGHGIDDEVGDGVDRLARRFFSRPLEEKLAIRMALGGRAWRGFFPLGDELTSGKPDRKEGIYFGAELDDDHPEVRAGTPLHGRNLFPDSVPELRSAVLRYIEEMTRLGHVIMRGIALSLGLEAWYFSERYTGDPLVLFRIFHYPPLAPSESDSVWGVGEHTDYGLLTIVRLDDCGGLEVKSPSGWIEAPPVPGAFVCNIGDMLDRMTGGFYRSTPHRARNVSGRDRISLPFFFDPNWNAEVHPVVPGAAVVDDAAERWDRASVHAFRGTYGEYLLSKVSRVFPELRRSAIPGL
jgi:isopenicillin N synthase-like dioxygenase